MPSSPLSIEVKGLGKSYMLYDRPVSRLMQSLMGGRKVFGQTFVALDDVSFSLARGEVLGIVGNNGAGKSTLLQLICGTLKPSTGRVSVNGRIAALLELGAGFNPEFSGRENVFLSAAIFGLTREEIDVKYDEIVAFSGIGSFIEQPVKTYSSGMFVRLAFSIATSMNPEILVIDEALSVGDGAFARKSFDRIMALRDGGATILFCSHSMYHIEAICNQALWLERGKVRMLGRPDEVTRLYAAEQMGVRPSTEHEKNSDPKSSVARIVSIEARSGERSGNTLQLRPGDPLQLDVSFRFDPELPLPSVAFGIETAGGVAVSSGGTFFDDVAPEIVAPGTGRLQLIFPCLPLMKGSYRLTIFLGCERGIHVYDQALYCVELEIVHDGNEQGMCFLERAWNGGAPRLLK